MSSFLGFVTRLHLGRWCTSRWATMPSERRGREEGLDAQVEQSQDRARRVVGVQGREHQVAGERRLNRDDRRLQVADLAHQDDVGS